MDESNFFAQAYDRLVKLGDDTAEIKADARYTRDRMSDLTADVKDLDSRLKAVEGQRTHIAANITSVISLLLAIGAPILLFLLSGGKLS